MVYALPVASNGASIRVCWRHGLHTAAASSAGILELQVTLRHSHLAVKALSLHTTWPDCLFLVNPLQSDVEGSSPAASSSDLGSPGSSSDAGQAGDAGDPTMRAQEIINRAVSRRLLTACM